MIYNNFYNGIRESKYEQDGFADMTNADVYTEIGTMRCNKASTLEDFTITAPMYTAVGKSGVVYFFSLTDGTIKKRSVAGVYSAVTSNAQGACLGAKYFDSRIYYATATKVGRFDDGTETNKNDSFATLTSTTGGGSYHPMEVINNILHIGNGKYIATINSSSTFSDLAMTFPSKNLSSVLKAYGYDILNFTQTGGYMIDAGVFRWDTSSSSWSSEDRINETGVNYVIGSDDSDEVYISAGSSGNLYRYDGQRLDHFMKIPNATNYINWQQSSTYGRRPVFSVRGKVYSLARLKRGMEPALVHEFTCSAGENAYIYSLVSFSGSLGILWNSAGSTGFDIVNTDKSYATATITTPQFEGKAKKVEVSYESVPSGTTISIEVKRDGGDWESWTSKTDTIAKKTYTSVEIQNDNFMQARITLTPTVTATPIIKSIEIL